MDNNDTEPEPMESEAADSNQLKDQVNNNMEDERIRQKKNENAYRKEIIMASGKQFIKFFHNLLKKTNATKEEMFLYLQRVYHSIFFFGHINELQIEPKDFIPAKSWEGFQNIFPKPLEEYKTHLPPQTPYSILLEYINKHHNGNKDSILEELKQLNKEMYATFYDDQKNQLQTKEFALSASVITCSSVNDPYNSNAPKTAFGASIAYKYRFPRRVMIAISTLHVWDKVISYEVRCGEHGHGIEFPCTVDCNAYKYDIKSKEYQLVPPCEKCNQMYKVKFNPKFVKPTRTQDWKFGNCAETESLSNLLRDNINIRNAVFTSDDYGSNLSRKDILERFTAKHEGELKKEIKNLLGSRGLNATDWPLFSPAKYVSH